MFGPSRPRTGSLASEGSAPTSASSDLHAWRQEHRAMNASYTNRMFVY